MAKLKLNGLLAIVVLLIAVFTTAVAGETTMLPSPIGCGSVTNGLTPLPCQSTVTTIDATVTSSTTAIHNITVTSTVPAGTITKTISQVLTPAYSVTSVVTSVVTSATGFCFGGAKDIITPCTQLMAGPTLAKPNAASELQNPFKSVTKFFKGFAKSDDFRKAYNTACPWEILLPVLTFFMMVLEALLVWLYWEDDSTVLQGKLIRGLQVILFIMIIALGYEINMGDPHKLFGF